MAAFVQETLKNQINLSILELAEYLYLVRLFYSKCQGAFLIGEYSLNTCIADAWMNVSVNEPDKIVLLNIIMC